MATAKIYLVLGKRRGSGMMPNWVEAWERKYQEEDEGIKVWEQCRDGQPYGDQLALSRCAYHMRRRDFAYERYIAAEERATI